MIPGSCFLESILPCMISESCMFRKCIAWYDFRVLNSKKVYCLVWFQDPLSSESINLSPWPCISLVSVLECVSTPPGDFFANMVSPAKMTITASTASKFCARSRSECSDIFFLDLESMWIPGNIEPWSECQPEGSRLRSAKSNSVLGPGAKLRNANCLSVVESSAQ